MESKAEKESRYRFLFKNLIRGLLILAIFITAFVLFNKFDGKDYIQWLEPIYSEPYLVILIYSISELLFGILPPEIFMAWSLKEGTSSIYVLLVALLAGISYGAGLINYYVGKTLRNYRHFRWFTRKYMKKYFIYFSKFGGFLLIVASVTPLPYAAICLLVGTVNYPKRKFLFYTLFRLLRFAVYAFIVFKAGKI